MGGADETPAVTLPPSSLRFLGFLNQPESDTKPTDRFELDEGDVIWASHLSSDPVVPQSDSDSDSEPEPDASHHPPGSGLSAIFAEDPRPIRSLTGPIGSGPGTMAKSAPVNVPMWHRRRTTRFDDALDEEEEEEGDDDVEEEMVPPHVMAARSHMMNFSVFEGVGRTLKGRDQRSVRNAVFQKTGFLD